MSNSDKPLANNEKHKNVWFARSEEICFQPDIPPPTPIRVEISNGHHRIGVIDRVGKVSPEFK